MVAEQLAFFNDVAPFTVRAHERQKYPNQPGYRIDGPSKDAAPTRTEASTLRSSVLAVIRQRPSTADECARLLSESILACRPRLSELVALGLIEDSGERRANESGKSATVWRSVV